VIQASISDSFFSREFQVSYESALTRKSLDWVSAIEQQKEIKSPSPHAQIGDVGQLVLGTEWATPFQFQPAVQTTDLREQVKQHVRSENLRLPMETLPITTW
jgi:hypothetical protein